MLKELKIVLVTVGVLGCLFAGSKIIAGSVISLQPGETYALDNGNVVACMGSSAPAAPSVITASCRLLIGGLPPFYGTGQGSSQADAQAQAERNAQDQCHQYAIQTNTTFLGGPGNNTPYDGCVPGPLNPAYYGCNN